MLKNKSTNKGEVGFLWVYPLFFLFVFIIFFIAFPLLNAYVTIPMGNLLLPNSNHTDPLNCPDGWEILGRFIEYVK